jgi:Tfp pilus assembly protein PilV
MGRIVLPEPKDVAARMGLRAQRQHADVQPTDGMANYRPEDIARTLAVAEHVRDEYALPLARGIYASGNAARMAAARHKLGVDRQVARDFESPDDMSAIAMSYEDKPAVESAVGDAMQMPDYEGMVAKPFLQRRDVPIVAGSQLPAATAPAPVAAAPMERAPQMDSLTVDAGVGKKFVVEPPDRAELPQPAIQQTFESFQGASPAAQIPSYSVDVDENMVYDQNQLVSLVQSAKATNDPAQMSRVAHIIDTQPMPDVVPETWSDFFMPDQQRQRVRSKLKQALGLGSNASSAADPLKVAEFQRKAAADAAKMPGWRAESHKKAIDAAYAETEAQQRVVTGDIKNDLNRLRAMVVQAKIPREVAAAELAQIKAAYGERETRAKIAEMKAQGWLAGERAKTEDQLRDDRQHGIQAKAALDEQRATESKALLEPRRRELVERAALHGRLPPTTVSAGAGFSKQTEIDKEIARLEGDIAGHQQWMQDNPLPASGKTNQKQAIATARAIASGDQAKVSGVLAARQKEFQERRAEAVKAAKRIEELRKLRATIPESSFSTTRTSTPRGE